MCEVDAPSVVALDRVKYWFKNGALHHSGDLPAVIEPNGTMKWWYEGSQYRQWGPTQVDSKGVVFSVLSKNGVFRKKVCTEETAVAEYAGIEYSAPYWMVEVYSGGDV